MVDRLASEQQLPQLGGEQRELTVLFCDLRGFTALTERLEPAALTRLANSFFAVATQAILEHGGTVDKYIGDAIMAFWNAPIETPNHAELACRAALRILEQVRDLNATLAQEAGMPTLAVGIGVNTGTCTVGNFGSSRRFDYSAIGDPVNVAARLEGETKEHGTAILIGPLTADHVAAFAVLRLGPTRLRGRTTPVEIHALVGDETTRDSPPFAALLAPHAQWEACVQAGDIGQARRLAVGLAREAPPAIRPIYDAFLARTDPLRE
jgi:adenylate cyclase